MEIHDCPIAMRLGKIGLDFERPVAGLHGIIVLLQALQYGAKVTIHFALRPHRC